MIIPNEPARGPTSDTKDKWYLSYFEYQGGHPYARYISKDGWKLTATYFNTPEEALEAFQPFRQSPIPVANWEVSDRIRQEQMMKRDYEDLASWE
jgi:hypothetical protein